MNPRILWHHCAVMRFFGVFYQIAVRIRRRNRRQAARLNARIAELKAEQAMLLAQIQAREAAWQADVRARWFARAKRRKEEAQLPPDKRKFTPNRSGRRR